MTRAADYSRLARFSVSKSLDSFEFSAIPGLNKMLVLELARCEYILRRENIIALGNSGTGKTHVVLSLGLAACQKGFSLAFTTAAGLVHQLMEARVGQQGTLTYVWADQGSRPRVPRDQRYEWAYIFGAVCPGRGCGAALVLPLVNIAAMNLHLAEISRAVEPGSHAVVVLDGAGWHQAGGKLNLPDNISLLHLPPYSPELNPVENVWQYLRQNYLSHRVFDTYDAIVDACNALMEMPDRIKTTASRNWAIL